MPGTWSAITNPPPAAVATTFLLTDGSVLAQGVSTNQWYRLQPAANGDYAAGTWTTMAASVHAPLYYGSGVLRDGRVIVAGGEYDAGAMVWLLNVECYDPVNNTWVTLPTPAGWIRIGDAPACVLPDGRFFLGQVGYRDTAIYDPATNAWTAAANKINAVGEESWSLLPDGSIHAVDCSNPPNSEKYLIAADTWVAAGTTPQTLVDSISEIGASVLLPDGRVFVIGATGFTATYTPPPIANQTGAWAQGPSIPQANPNQPLGAVDGPACLLPTGNVLFTAGPITSPASFQAPTFFFEYDPVSNTTTQVASAATSNTQPYWGRMLMLPSGQVLYTAGSTSIELYTPNGGPDPTWVPTITACPASVRRGATYRLSGRQINGLSQCVYYGNDATQATNYPIVRLESSTGVFYCRTSNFSTMGLQTGTVVHGCDFTVPASVPDGSYCLRVIANGIASQCRQIAVTHKFFKELKYEIKEKLEIIDSIKEIRDLRVKRIPDIIDRKQIVEDFDIFDRIHDDWVKSVRTIAEGIDQSNAEMSRAFITPKERPMVGPPEPVIEKLNVPRISAAQARRDSEKRAFNDGRKELAVSKQAAKLHELVHALSKSKGEGFGKVDGSGNVSKKRAAKPGKRGKRR